MKTWSVEVRPVISQEVEADTWEEARGKIKETFEEHPWELEDVDDCKIHDVTPPNEEEQKLLNRLEGLIEENVRWGTPDSVDVKNVTFKEDEYEDVLEEGELPRLVYADLHIYDGGGGHTIEKDVEYDVKKLLETEKKSASK